MELSKTKYCKGIQCPKMLWMDRYMPEMAEDVLSETVMANGNAVGDLARSYFGAYALVDFDYDKRVMAERTRSLMEQGAENIAEAAFYRDGLYCAVDILRRNGDGYAIVEVKSSTHVTDIYIDDMAFQYHVLRLCGVPVKRVYNMHLNSSYVRHGDLELDKLFTLEDHTDEVMRRADHVAENVSAIRAFTAADEEPTRDIGIYCESPYQCAYFGYCGRHLPKHSVFEISRLWTAKKYDYYHRGIVADSFPDLANHLLAIRENIRDLMVPFQKHYYYSKAMQGSYSIKYVLPALCPGDPELDYHMLDGVHNGSEASAAFAEMANRTPEEIAETRRNLLRYCRLDTLAMVKVLAKLCEVCGV